MDLTRANLQQRVVERLSEGGFGNPDVYLARDGGGGLVVVKDFLPRPAWLRSTWGAWMMRRELRAYRILEEAPCVPKLLGVIDDLAFVLEYRPGTLLSRALRGTLPGSFVDELAEAVAEMHARGVVHLDLRHRSNVLAGDDGHPVLIDFASALCLDRASPWGRWAFAWFSHVDAGAVAKWRMKLE